MQQSMSLNFPAPVHLCGCVLQYPFYATLRTKPKASYSQGKCSTHGLASPDFLSNEPTFLISVIASSVLNSWSSQII